MVLRQARSARGQRQDVPDRIARRRIRKVDTNGIITTVVGSGVEGYAGDGGPAKDARIAGPQQIVFDRAGNLYIGDGRNRVVRKVDTNGIITTVAGGGTAAVADGAKATSVGLIAPRGIAVDAAGNVFIGDGGLNRILKVSPAGVLSIVAGTGTIGFSGDDGPAAQAQFNAGFPRMIADSAGNLFFGDSSNHRIRKITPEGIISTVAGSGPAFPAPGSFSGDGGPATAARLWGANNPMIDAAGNLYFLDVTNNRIRMVAGAAAPGLFGGP